ncbi:PilN domain-containing protein [Alteribacter populi]|uniref:PilN domain-containing protein n=1 Tax=Alteribacter populi TaxID=2011011 RepID=UPI000BBB3826|nr:hypothetical protein [Alteribacter populi]
MPVEINLMPKQEKKDRTILYFLGGFLILSLLAVVSVGFYGSHIEEQSAAVEEELIEKRLESAELQNEIDSLSDADKVKLNLMIEELDSKVIPGSAVLQEMVSLMPPEGYFLEYEYSFPFEIYLEAGFYEIRDIAYYLRAIEDSDIVASVTLLQIEGEDMTENEEEEEQSNESFASEQNQEQYLPHYVAALSVTLNPEAVKTHGEEEDTGETVDTEEAPPANEEDTEDDLNTDFDLDLDIDADVEIDDEVDINFELDNETDENGGDL